MTVRNIVCAALAAFTAVAATAREAVLSDRVEKEISMFIGGTLIVENTTGTITVTGSDNPNLLIQAERVVRGVDDSATAEGRQQTQVRITGDDRLRLVQTVMPLRPGRWSSTVNYAIRVPQTAHVKISSGSSSRITVADIRGSVLVKNVNGAISLNGITGPSQVESANGNIVFATSGRLADAVLTSVNGSIEMHLPGNASFQWEGETLKGEARTTFPVHVTYVGTAFRGSVNTPGGPTIATRSLMGNIVLLKNGTLAATARSVKRGAAEAAPVTTPANRQSGETSFVAYDRALGDWVLGEIRGNVHVSTGAGQVQLGLVSGLCEVVSGGGPLNLGYITGGLNARTEAGDVLVQAARSGGTVTTGGGIIRVIYAAGPLRLQSGGGDILVRQALAPVNAETQSGDISITLDPGNRSERISAKTSKGNVFIYVPQSFAADIDATVITSDPAAMKINSDLAGLSFRREDIGGKTKIRATGKVNGGGERVELYAEDGGITISTRPAGTGAQ